MARKKKAKTKAARSGKRAAGKGRKAPRARAVKARRAVKAPKKASRPAARKANKGAAADERYRESLRKFSKTHDVEALARQAALDLEPDLRESGDKDVADSARRGAEEEPEW